MTLFISTMKHFLLPHNLDLRKLVNQAATFFNHCYCRYIYDAKGVELHCMRRHERPFRLDFLPYHFLLTTIGHSGWIKWHDISTGQYVSGHSTGFGPSRVLTHNPVNAVSFVGHSNGVVSLWSPAAGKALVSVFAHKSPVSDVAVDAEGRYMVTSGLDGFVKVWDLRKYSCLHALRPDHPALSVDISHRGLIALAVGRQVQVLKDAFVGSSFTTYMQHEVVPSRASQSCGDHIAARMNSLRSSVAVQSVKFRPFEDILGIGHSHGVSAIVVPGAGEPNFDSFENNPFSNPKQRRESEIQSLISKLSHDMIGLGTVLHCITIYLLLCSALYCLYCLSIWRVSVLWCLPYYLRRLCSMFVTSGVCRVRRLVVRGICGQERHRPQVGTARAVLLSQQERSGGPEEGTLLYFR